MTPEGENWQGAEWVTTRQAARILGITTEGVTKLVWRKRLTRYGPTYRSYFRRTEIEDMARDHCRLRRQANQERNRTRRLTPNPAWEPSPDRRIDSKTAMRILDVSNVMLCYLVCTGQLMTYQRIPGRSRHWFEPTDVEALRERRAQQQEAQRACEWGAPTRKTRRQFCGSHRVQVEQLSVHEHYFGEWLTARQVAWMLYVSMGQVYRLRDQGRLLGRQQPTLVGGLMQWHFLKADVQALENDPVYCRNRLHYEQHCTPEGKARKEQERARKEQEDLERQIIELSEMAQREHYANPPLVQIGRQW